MFILKWPLETILSKHNDLGGGWVKRLVLIALENAQNTLASLGDDKAGTISKEGILTIEEIIDK